MGYSISVKLSEPDVLDCPICVKPLASPVFQCENGHIACSSCCPKLRMECHTCSKSVGYIRCLAIEKVVESIKVYCQYSLYGCEETISYCQKNKHEEACIYAPRCCPVSNCNFDVSYKQLFFHFNDTHSSLFRPFRYRSRFTVCFDRNEPLLVFKEERDGSLFFLNNRKAQTGNYLTMTAVGGTSTASKSGFFYKLKTSKGSSRTFRSYTKCVKSLQDDASSFTGFLVPCDFSRSGQLELEVSIWGSK